MIAKLAKTKNCDAGNFFTSRKKCGLHICGGEAIENIDFIGQKGVVNNLRTKDNMLSSKLPSHLRKTMAPTKAVRGVSPF